MSTIQPTGQIPDTSRESHDPQHLISSRIAGNPALLSRNDLVKDRSWVEADPFRDHVQKYGYAILHDDALALIRACTEPHAHKVLSLFTGLGYAEAQMVSQGLEVIGFDRMVMKERWLLDTHEGPGEMSFERFADRALFLSFPDPTTKDCGRSEPVSFVNRFIEAGGSTVITINENRPREHGIRCDQELLDLLKQGQCLGEVALPAWPTVMCFVGRGHTHSDFQPVLQVHRLAGDLRKMPPPSRPGW